MCRFFVPKPLFGDYWILGLNQGMVGISATLGYTAGRLCLRCVEEVNP